jgi:hypothetical protein
VQYINKKAISKVCMSLSNIADQLLGRNGIYSLYIFCTKYYKNATFNLMHEIKQFLAVYGLMVWVNEVQFPKWIFLCLCIRIGSEAHPPSLLSNQYTDLPWGKAARACS